MPTKAERALRHAVRPRVVARYVGELCLALGATASIPILAAVVFRETHLVLPYALAGALFVALGLLARRIPAPRDLQRHEGLVVIAVVFTLAPIILSGPLVLQGVPFGDAFFEAVSGFTTTGLSTLASVETHSRTFLLARAWMQWVGGLGFVVLSLALLLEPGMASRRLGAPSLDPADIAVGARVHAQRVLRIYLALTALGLVVLLLLGATPFDAVVHTFASVSTGGFAPRDASLAPLAGPLQAGVLGLCLLGAVSLPLYSGLRQQRGKRLRGDLELRALLVLVAAAAVLLVASTRLAGEGPRPAAFDLVLTAVSAQTTAGFAVIPAVDLPAASQLVLIVAMLVGGCQGSTAGGMKVLRVLSMTRLVLWLVGRTRLPAHAVTSPTLGGVSLHTEELLRTAALIALFLVGVMLSWLAFLAFGYPPLEALFEVTSATGTVGLSTGITRPELEPFLKAVLCTNMLLGRVEVFAVLVTLAPRTWVGRRTS